MKKYIALISIILFFFTTVSASEDIAEANQILGENDVVIYSHGPQACDTNCHLGREIAEETILEGNLDYRPPTPEVGKTDKNLVLIGNGTLNYIERSQEYNTEDFGLESLGDNEGRLSFHKTSSNGKHVLVIRGDSRKSLYSAGQFFIDLMNGQYQGEVSGQSSYSVDGARYEKDYTLGDIPDILNRPLIVYGADTQSTRQTAQELALAMNGEAINDRDVEESDKEDRDFVLMNTPPTNRFTEELAQEGKVWSSEDWSEIDGFRLNLVKNAFSFDNHVLIVSGDVGSRTALASKYAMEFYDGEHQDIGDKTSVTRSKLPRTLEVDTTHSMQPKVGDSIPLTVTAKETGDELTDYELTISRDGENVTSKDSISLAREGKVSVLTPEKYGNYTILATKEATSEEVYESDKLDIGVKRPVRTEKLEVNIEPSTAAPKEEVEISPSVNGKPVEAKLYLNDELIGSDENFEIQPEELGDHQIEVRKPDKRTDTEIVDYTAGDTVLTVEERSFTGKIQHFFASLI